MISYKVIYPLSIYTIGICEVISRQKRDYLVFNGFTDNLKEVVNMPQEWLADLLILGVFTRTGDELTIIDNLRKKMRKAVILMITTVGYEDVMRKGLVKGANGFIYNDCAESELIQAIDGILNNQVITPHGFRIHPDLNDINTNKSSPKLDFNITSREKEILVLITKGYNNRSIAQHLFISEQTVAVHRKNLFRKLGVKNTMALLMTAKERHLIT